MRWQLTNLLPSKRRWKRSGSGVLVPNTSRAPLALKSMISHPRSTSLITAMARRLQGSLWTFRLSACANEIWNLICALSVRNRPQLGRSSCQIDQERRLVSRRPKGGCFLFLYAVSCAFRRRNTLAVFKRNHNCPPGSLASAELNSSRLRLGTIS